MTDTTLWCKRDPERPERCATHDQDWDFCLVYTPPGTWSDEDAALHLDEADMRQS